MWPFSRKNKSVVSASSRPEREPLLSENATRPEGEATPVICKPKTPLPVRQLIVLCAMRFTEPISYTLIFPFINQMLNDLKVTDDPKKIGYYGGVIESIFAISQLCTALFWGRLSDQIGRKPVMLTGLSGTAVSVVSFGLQKHFTGLVIARAVSGMMNGNVAILQSVVAEITDETNYAQAVALLPLCFACGLIVGPIIGGYLAAPAQQYPALFGTCGFLIEYPYFLPCFIGGMFNVGAILLGGFFLEETLPSKRKQDSSSNDMIEPSKPVDKSQPPSILSLCTKKVMLAILTFLAIHLQNTAWSATLPLYGQTSVLYGGLGLSLNEIGFLLGTQGIGIILIQVFVFPMLQGKFGAWRLLQYSIPFSYFPLVLVPLVTKSAQNFQNSSFPLTLGFMILTSFLRSPITMCYVCSIIILKELSPAPNCLGTLNGMMQTAAALSQTVGPIVGSSLFAFSISSNLLGGNLVWLFMFLFALIPQTLSCRLVRAAEKRGGQDDLENSMDEGDQNNFNSNHDREIEGLDEFLRAEDSRISVPSEHQSTPILVRKSSWTGSTGGGLMFGSVSSRSSHLTRNNNAFSA